MLRVTEAIKHSGIGPDYSVVPEAYLHAKAVFGTTVHALCSQATKEKVRLPDTPEGECARSFVKWIWTSRAEVIDSEFEVKGCVAGIDYLGHPDLLFKWVGIKYLVDLKCTSSLYSCFGIQTSAYLSAYEREHGRDGIQRAILWLRPGKAAQLICGPPIIRPLDSEMWKSILVAHAWIMGAKV